MTGIAEDVPFDGAAATELAETCDRAAALLSEQAPSRSSWVSIGLTEFTGFFADIFRSNGATQAADARLLSSRLRQVAQGARRLKEEADREQRRRETAREWKRQQEERNLLDQAHDFLFGEEQPPVGPPAEEVVIPPVQLTLGSRETPTQGTGHASTSSARPENLRTFATRSSEGNDALAAHPRRIRDAYEEFLATCHYGGLEAEGVLVGFDRYLEANRNDVTWARTVADAFASAGGEGVVSVLPNAAIAAALAARDVAVTRDVLTIEEPQAYGGPPTTGYANDPVNTSTGNFLEPESDLAFTGGSATLAWTRMYNSMNTAVGAFGPGWSSWTDSGLTLDADVARWTLQDGRQIHFPRQGSGWERSTTEAYWLEETESGFRVVDNAGGSWRFTASGRLSTLSRGEGTTIACEYVGDRLTGLRHERGRGLGVTWSGERISRIVADDGRSVEYSYDDLGRLIAVSSREGPGTTGGTTTA